MRETQVLATPSAASLRDSFLYPNIRKAEIFKHGQRESNFAVLGELDFFFPSLRMPWKGGRNKFPFFNGCNV